MVICINFENQLVEIVLLGAYDIVQAQPLLPFCKELSCCILVIHFVESHLVENFEAHDFGLDIALHGTLRLI